MAVMTRKDMATRLESKGVTGEALECLLRETGRDRHESRVEAARMAAEEWYLSKSGLERADVPEGVLRAGAAAILQAARYLGGWFTVMNAPVWSKEEQRVVPVPMLFYHIHDVGMVEVSEAFMPEQWMWSVLREGLRRAAGLNPWHPQVPFDHDEGILPMWAELVGEWAPVPEPEWAPVPVAGSVDS